MIHTIISAGHHSTSDISSTSIDLGVLTRHAKLLAKLYWRRQHDRADTTAEYVTFSHDRVPPELLTLERSLGHMPLRPTRWLVQPGCPHSQQHGRLRCHVRRHPLQHARLGDQWLLPLSHERRKLGPHVVPRKRY